MIMSFMPDMDFGKILQAGFSGFAFLIVVFVGMYLQKIRAKVDDKHVIHLWASYMFFVLVIVGLAFSLNYLAIVKKPGKLGNTITIVARPVKHNLEILHQGQALAFDEQGRIQFEVEDDHNIMVNLYDLIKELEQSKIKAPARDEDDSGI